jgi:hypothetical protein
MLFASTGSTVSPGQIDCTTISTRSTARGMVAMIMSTAITVSGMTGNGSGCSVANRRGQMYPKPRAQPSRFPKRRLRAPRPGPVTVARMPKQ